MTGQSARRRQAIFVKLEKEHPMHGKTILEYEMSQKPTGYGLEKKRWGILIAFCLFSCSNAAAWITFSPIIETVQSYYGITEDQVIQFANVYNYFYVLSFFGAYFVEKYFAKSLLLAMALSALGSWIRLVGESDYTVAMIGQSMCGIAQNVILFVPVAIADRWFPPSESLLSVSLGSFANILGWGVGFLIPPLVQNTWPENPLPPLLIIEGIFCTIPLLIAIPFFRENPKFPPSFCALKKQIEPRKMLPDIWAALKNKTYMLASFNFGNMIGISYSITTVLPIFVPFLTVLDQGYMGLLFVCVGILGGLIGSWVLNKYGSVNYDRTLKAFSHISFLGLILFAALIYTQSMIFVGFILAILGIGLLGFQPFACQLCSETSYPVPETISNNIMVVWANLLGLVANYSSTAESFGDKGLWALVVLMTISWIYMTFFYKGDYRKLKAEKDAQNAAKKVQDEKIEINI